MHPTPTGTESAGTRGYVRLTGLHNHPLADNRGRVYRHRYVLHHALGGTTQPCHWCDYHVAWHIDHAGLDHHIEPRDRHRYLINADHLNDTPGDDRPENLAPACGWCNIHRGWVQDLAPHIWTQALRYLHTIAPWDRPNLLPIVLDELNATHIDTRTREVTHAPTP